MKNWLKENWFKVGLLAILFIFIAGAFYWYEWRPMQIRQHCNEIALNGARNCKRLFVNDCLIDSTAYNEKYDACVRDHGLEK